MAIDLTLIMKSLILNTNFYLMATLPIDLTLIMKLLILISIQWPLWLLI